jgi:predicted nucleotidyltransferase component of viral defense system
MRKDAPHDLAASVRQRLQNLARQRQEDFQLVLGRFALERLLYRISQSRHHDQFVVKGAMLFHLWSDQPHRPTRDLDLLARGGHSIGHLEKAFREVCDQAVEHDGLVFLANSVAGEVIKPDQEYEGVRIRLEARLQRARIPVQVDLGFGDTITPGPEQVQYPSMLGFPTPVVSVYPKETVVAEKLQAMVMLGMANSRMKDFFDLWLLAEQFEFAGAVLSRAIRATFDRRRTPIPDAVPLALTDEFCADRAKQTQWRAFAAKGHLATGAPPLSELVGILRSFLCPPIEAVRAALPFRQQWKPAGPWRA